MDSSEIPPVLDEPMSGVDAPAPEDEELQVSHAISKNQRIRSEQVLEVNP